MLLRRWTILGVLIPIFLSYGTGAAQGQAAHARPLAGLDEYVRELMTDWHVPGLAIAIVRLGDEGDLLREFGHRDVERGLPVTSKTVFGIGSCAKAFTAAAVAALVSDGTLSWGSPLREYVPQFRLYDDYSTAHATARDLLLHRTGLAEHEMLKHLVSLNGQNLWEKLEHLRPASGFRDRFRYSNLSYQILGEVVEEVSGESYGDFVRGRILNPLDMKNTTFSYSEARAFSDFATPYMNFTPTAMWGTVLKQSPIQLDTSNEALTAPSGGVYSSLEDMAKWVRFQLERGRVGGRQVIAERAMKMMHTPGIGIRYDPDDHDEPSLSYGMGWYVQDYRGHYLVQHEGQVYGYMASVSFLPMDSIGVIVLTNSYYHHVPSILSEYVLDRLLGLSWEKRSAAVLEGFRPAAKALYDKTSGFWQRSPRDAPPTHAVQAYAGTFVHPVYGTVRVEQDSGHLRAVFKENMIVNLRHFSYDTFATESDIWDYNQVSFHFELGPSGQVDGVRIALDGVEGGVLFQRPG